MNNTKRLELEKKNQKRSLLHQIMIHTNQKASTIRRKGHASDVIVQMRGTDS